MRVVGHGTLQRSEFETHPACSQPGGQPPTDFKPTKSSASLAVFENPKHDHPKVITYRLESSGTLVATIEGDEDGQHKKEEFRFQRASRQ
ncbi:MAG: DUF6265 family protein [Acidobacteriia bacterium]|nr:DUF6265 family protein [Terriglobia bacterium]